MKLRKTALDEFPCIKRNGAIWNKHGETTIEKCM